MNTSSFNTKTQFQRELADLLSVKYAIKILQNTPKNARVFRIGCMSQSYDGNELLNGMSIMKGELFISMKQSDKYTWGYRVNEHFKPCFGWVLTSHIHEKEITANEVLALLSTNTHLNEYFKSSCIQDRENCDEPSYDTIPSMSIENFSYNDDIISVIPYQKNNVTTLNLLLAKESYQAKKKNIKLLNFMEGDLVNIKIKDNNSGWAWGERYQYNDGYWDIDFGWFPLCYTYKTNINELTLFAVINQHMKHENAQKLLTDFIKNN